MVSDGDDRSRLEDAFDDLDRYFSGEAARAGRPQGAADRQEPSGTPEAGDPMAGTGDLEDELLPPGWAPDVDDLQLEQGEEGTGRSRLPSETETPGPTMAAESEPPGYRPEAPKHKSDEVEWGPDPGEPAESSAPEDQDEQESEQVPDMPEDDVVIWKGEPGEMEGDDWRRLRDVLGEDEEDEAVDFGRGPAPEATAESPQAHLPGEEGQAAEEEWLPAPREELTLDDLKKAPPEYRDLPGVYEATVEPESVDAGTEPTEGEETAEEPAEGAPQWDEPDIAEVEAAADQLAYEFREAEEPDEVERELLADLDRPGPRTVRVGPEGMTGPAWEEPTSRVVMAEPSTPEPGGRDMPAALLTAAVLAAAALISLAWSKAAFAVVASLVVLLGQAELYGTMTKRGHQPATALGLVVGALILAGAYLKGEQAMLFFVALGLVLSFLWYMAAAPKSREGAIGNIGTTMLGIVYVPFLAAYMLLILSQPSSGRAIMLAVLGLTFLFDVVAFGVGSLYGARALAPTISPRKSWEGLLAAAVVTFGVSIAGVAAISPIDTWGRAAGLWLAVVVFAPLGDLAESAIKRDLGVKDMGSILPGHGGVLDRIDSVLFVAPAAFYFLRLVF